MGTSASANDFQYINSFVLYVKTEKKIRHRRQILQRKTSSFFDNLSERCHEPFYSINTTHMLSQIVPTVKASDECLTLV